MHHQYNQYNILYYNSIVADERNDYNFFENNNYPSHSILCYKILYTDGHEPMILRLCTFIVKLIDDFVRFPLCCV